MTHGSLGLTVSEGVVPDIVRSGEGEVEEQARDVSSLILHAFVLRLLQGPKGNGERSEHEAHASRGKHEHAAALEPGDNKGKDGPVNQAPAGVSNVDPGLGILRIKAHHFEKVVGIVADQGVSRELGKEAEEDRDVDTAAHSRGFDKVHPGLLGNLHLGLDRLPNLGDLSLDKERVSIALGMIFYQNRGCLFAPILRDEESGRLGKEAKRLGISKWNGSNMAAQASHKTVIICRREGQIWRSEGRRQAQSVLIWAVGIAMLAAMI